MEGQGQGDEVLGYGLELQTATVSESEQPPSKRALKRKEKMAKWEERKKSKREAEKGRKKKQRAKYAGTEFSRKALKKRRMEVSHCTVGIAIDLSFDELMNEKDICKTVKQVHWCYSINRRQPNPLQYHVTSFVGKSASLMAVKHDGFTNWDVKFHNEPFDNVFDKSALVYLSSDSENVLDRIESDKVYIIGGIVDHNSKKGVSYLAAVSKGIAHARLPIDEFLEMKTRQVLSIVHVFEIIAKMAQKDASWSDTLLSVIPQRKLAEAKETLDDSENDN